MKTTITLLSALALATSLSFGQEPTAGPKGPKGPGGHPGGRPNPEEIFKKLDANDDKSISLDEFKAGPMGKKDPAKAEEVFKKVDADSSGGVSLEEFKAHRPPHRGGPGKDGPHKKAPDKDGPPAEAPAPAAE